ncbi:hypothetical protein TNCV_1295451 [Trichonephila clavipes]|nr:hypothetical protein TNCV_1295451 [Trichonephila clavipes]
MDHGRRFSLELHKIDKPPDSVKLQRLQWAGHLARVNEDRCCKKIFMAKPMRNRPRDVYENLAFYDTVCVAARGQGNGLMAGVS